MNTRLVIEPGSPADRAYREGVAQGSADAIEYIDNRGLVPPKFRRCCAAMHTELEYPSCEAPGHWYDIEVSMDRIRGWESALHRYIREPAGLSASRSLGWRFGRNTAIRDRAYAALAGA